MIPQLTKVLKDLMEEEKKRKRQIPDKPRVPIPRRKNTATLGKGSKQRGKLDSNTQEKENEFELNSRIKWKTQ